MKLINHDVYKFDDFLPIYNWFYPLSGHSTPSLSGDNSSEIFNVIPKAIGRALYIHIPFCETICTFCPFVRGKFTNRNIIESYVQALMNEIKFKARYKTVTDVPIHAIFIGGGTPSMLSPEQLERIGKLLHNCFDFSQLKEFSFEFEIKSIRPDLIDSLLSIGGTHARFGVQTFSPRFREAFNLSYTQEELETGAALLKKKMKYVSCDMLFGMNGQSIDELEQDINCAVSLGLDNIDYYPINNLMTQLKLHKYFKEENLLPHSGSTKHYMNMFVRKALEEHNFYPHNGHGYVKHAVPSVNVVSDEYSFIYHDHVYGSLDYDLIGFGNNAISSFAGYTTQNTTSRHKYINLARDNIFKHVAHSHGHNLDICRPISLTLPYHGKVAKTSIDMELIPLEIKERLKHLIESQLIVETDDSYELTRIGWEWYSCIMYYLLPSSERSVVADIVKRGRKNPHRKIETNGIQMTSVSPQVPA